MESRIHIGIVAGEASGDALGASLIFRLRQQFPDLRVSGIGGPGMIAEGMESLYDMERLSVMGFVEPLKRLPELLSMRRQLVRHFLHSKADLFIGIDSPDFNLGIASRLHKTGMKTVQYVSPSVWAWRQGRVKGIRCSIDLMLTLFPFESHFYEREGVPVEFVGHPLASEIPAPLDRDEARTTLGLPADIPVVALLPGSRRGEVEMMLPVFLETAKRLRAQIPDIEFIIPAANANLYRWIKEQIGNRAILIQGRAREAIAAANVVLLASGTSTLEVMLLDRPMVVAYRLGNLTYQIARHLVRTPHIAIPNLLAGRALVPEYIQAQAQPEVLSRALLKLLKNPATAAAQRQAFEPLRDQLAKDSAGRAAAAIARLMSN